MNLERTIKGFAEAQEKYSPYPLTAGIYDNDMNWIRGRIFEDEESWEHYRRINVRNPKSIIRIVRDKNEVLFDVQNISERDAAGYGLTDN